MTLLFLHSSIIEEQVIDSDQFHQHNCKDECCVGRLRLLAQMCMEHMRSLISLKSGNSLALYARLV